MIAGRERRLLLGSLIVVGSAACFGTLGPLSRFAYHAGLTPLGFTAWRGLIGGAFVGAAVIWRIRRGGASADLRRIPRREQAMLGVAAIASMVLNLSIFTAFGRISVALALLGFYTYPALFALANATLHRERLGMGQLTALGLASGGIVLVLAGQLDPSAGLRLDLLGFAFALTAACAQVVNIMVSRRGFPSVPTDHATAFILLAGAAGFLLLGPLVGDPAAIAGPLADPPALPIMLVAGILGAGIPSTGFLTGVRWIGGVRTGILMLFEPVVGVVLAALLLGEALQPIQGLGGAFVLGAAVILQRTGEPSGVPMSVPAAGAADPSA